MIGGNQNSKPSKTSISHPLKVYTFNVLLNESNSPMLGISMLPGRTKQKVSFNWNRDLNLDLQVLINQYNVKNVVTLVTSKELAKDIPSTIAYLDEIQRLGMHSIHYPIVDKWIPNDMELFTQLIVSISEKVSNNEMTLIHCNGGKGRSAMVLAAVLFILQKDVNNNHSSPTDQGTYSDLYRVVQHIQTQCRGTLRNPLQLVYLCRFVHYWNNRMGRVDTKRPLDNST